MFARGFSTLAIATVAFGIAAALASPQGVLVRGVSADVIVPMSAPRVSEPTLDDIPRAVADLNDTTQMRSWQNVAGYLGLIGFPECFHPLHDFIWTKFHGDLDANALSAVYSAQANMGPVAASSHEALKYLIQCTNPYSWKALPWRDPRQPQGELWLSLSQMSIHALGLSGNAEAGQMLARLRQSPYREAQRPAIEEAIREHQRVIRAGGAMQYVASKWRPLGHWWRMAIREVPAARDSAMASSPIAGLKLALALDEDVYAFGQPIMVMACLRNVDSARVEIPSMAQQLDLRLETSDGGPVTPHRNLLGGLPTADSRRLTLEPSDVQCEVSDLLARYGVWPGKKHPVAAAAGEMVLPPGRYQLVAVYKPEVHRRPDGVVITVASDTVGFEIAPLERFPEEATLLRDFATQGHYDGHVEVGNLPRNFARPWLGRFVASRFFMLAYYLGEWWGHTDNLDSLVSALNVARVSPVRQAAVMWYQAKFDPRTYERQLSELANLKSRRFGAPQEAAARTWELRVRQVLERYRTPR